MGSQAKYRAGIEIRMLGNLGPMFDKLTSKVKRFTGALRPASRGLDNTFGKRRLMSLKKFSRGMDFAVQKTRMLRFAAIGAFAMATKVSADFEEQMFRTGFILDKLNTKQFADLKNNMRDLAGSTIFTPTQIASAAKELAKAGLSIEDINAQMPQFARFAQLAEGDVTSMAKDFAAAYKVVAEKGETPLSFMESMSSAMNTSRLTAESLGEMFKFAGSELANFEGPSSQIAAVSAALADSMQDGSRAGTGMRAVFKRMANPTGEAVTQLRKWVETAREAGMIIRSEDLFNKKGYIKDFEVLTQFLSKAGADAKGLDVVFGKIAGTSIASLLGREGLDGQTTNFAKATEKIEKYTKANEAAGGSMAKFDKGFKKTAKGSMLEFVSVLQDIGIQIGDSGLLSAVTDLLRLLIDLLKGFKDLNPSIKKGIVIFAALGTMFIWLLPIMAAFVSMLVMIPIAAAPIVLAVGLIVGALTLLGIATYMVRENIDDLVRWFKELFDVLVKWSVTPVLALWALVTEGPAGFLDKINEAIEATKILLGLETAEMEATRLMNEAVDPALLNRFRVNTEEAKRGVVSKGVNSAGEVIVYIKAEDGTIVTEMQSLGNVKLGENTGQQ